MTLYKLVYLLVTRSFSGHGTINVNHCRIELAKNNLMTSFSEWKSILN